MNNGRIELIDIPPSLFRHPRTAFVAGLMGVSNLLTGRYGVDGTTLDGDLLPGLALCGPTPGPPGQPMQIGLLPEDAVLHQADTPIDGARSWLRVLTKDSSYLFGVAGEGCGLLQVVQQAQRQVHHGAALGYHLGAAPEARQAVPDVAVVLLDGKRQVLAGEQLRLRDQAVVALPVIGDERLALHADLVEEPAAGRIITPTQNPGHGSPLIQVIGTPHPELGRLFFRKCHISSTSTVTTDEGTTGSGRLAASARTHFSTATSLTPSTRPIMLKLMPPMPYSSKAKAFIAGGLPRGGVSVKWHPHPRHR